MFKSSLVRAFLLFIISFNVCFANYVPQKFDVVEIIKEDKNKDFAKKNIKLYGVILSGKNYNTSSKNVIIAPLVKKPKKLKDANYIINITFEKEEYTIFVDRIRTTPKVKIKQSSIVLKQEEKSKIEVQFNNILK